MVNEKKVRIMTRLALDESKRYKQDIEVAAYYRSDYIRSRTIRVFWGVSMSYILLLALIVLYHMEYLFVNVVKLDYRSLGFIVLSIYASLIILCLLISVMYYSAKYTKSRKHLRDYMGKLKELEEFYEEDQEGENA